MTTEGHDMTPTTPPGPCHEHPWQRTTNHPPPASRATARGVDCGWDKADEDSGGREMKREGGTRRTREGKVGTDQDNDERGGRGKGHDEERGE